MKKILFLSKSNNDFGLFRQDWNMIMNDVVKTKYHVQIYDVKKSKLIDVSSKKTKYYGILPSGSKWAKNKFIIFFNFIFFLLRNQNKYDLVQINYVREEYLVLSRLVKNLGKNLIIMIYGTDFNYRTKIKDQFDSIYKNSDLILFTNPDLLQKFKSQHSNIDFKEKLQINMLPFEHFTNYENFTIEGKTKSKSELNIDPNKIVLSIGTNFYPNEQHELIIEQLQSLKDPEKYTLIFNLTGFDTVNTSRVEALEKLIREKLKNFEYKLVRGRLSDEEIAKYRFVTDIFINMRKNDQFVLSMLESNLAYSFVITGNWLPYQDYTSKTTTFVINEFNELNEVIEKVAYFTQKDRNTLLEKNRNYILENFNIADAINSWRKIYTEFLND